MAAVRLTKLGDEGTCPTIYRTDRGTIVVQGAKVLDDHGVNVPDQETLAEIPEELLRKVARAFA
ncbi:hypothetical protein HII36_27420 [Nonomuraea sp. NN258]|uniref:hypothetical protein n=1 Tax=Nonomuraea antri TaxID=2730852 RepID=UPI00156817AD|nr:hypothetical protein [Nonomuraea antri]NRQ35533.1 hypothetical protein [Nonomuraea antri]